MKVLKHSEMRTQSKIFKRSFLYSNTSASQLKSISLKPLEYAHVHASKLANIPHLKTSYAGLSNRI